MHKTTAEIIQHIVEQVIGHKLTHQPDPQLLLHVAVQPAADELQLIKYYIKNQHLITAELIATTVAQQFKLYPLPTIAFNNQKSATWEHYIAKLDKVLAEVRYRRAHNYEFNEVMPPVQQLLELQHECLQLTEQWYGAGNGNISCFYLYFIKMSQAAYVTSFEYLDIDKLVSPDRFVSQVNLEQRQQLFMQHEEHFFHDFVKQGGRWARGRSEIDATAISNVFYYKTAQLLFNQLYAKHLIVQELQLENYGQLAFEKRVQLWQLLQQNFPDHSTADEQSIFYRFVQYINAAPGEFFNYFSAELPEATVVAPQQLFDIIKIAGIQTNRLVLLSREVVDNWPPKRNLNLHWIRKYALPNTAVAGHHEWPRIWPNEIPYAPAHGLSLCGNGLISGWERYGSIAYEWNTPTDPVAEENNIARDIEKIFRELKLLNPNTKLRSLLPGEQLLSIFQNAIAYSTIKITQHTHIMQCTVDGYLLYKMSTGKLLQMPLLNASLEFVPSGTSQDAFFIKLYFDNLDNEPLIKFLIQLNQAYLDYFGADKVDAYIHLFACEDGGYVFIYEPHAHLIQLEFNQFLNPETDAVSVRRPQMIQPQGKQIDFLGDQLAAGREFLVQLFDATCKQGAYKFCKDFIDQYQRSHQ